VIRDQQEATTVRVRLDEARIEKLLAGYDPWDRGRESPSR
jgi:hypothetical protein